MIERTRIGDSAVAALGAHRGGDDLIVPRGHLHVVLRDETTGEVKLDEIVENLITRIGDQFYGERGAGISGAPAAVTGMQLGTGTTAPSKTGAGAAIGTLVANSLVALAANPASSLQGEARRIVYTATWAAGVATANGIAEVALVNQATGTQTTAPASATIARALLSPTVNKGAADSLTVTWNHDLQAQ